MWRYHIPILHIKIASKSNLILVSSIKVAVLYLNYPLNRNHMNHPYLNSLYEPHYYSRQYLCYLRV